MSATDETRATDDLRQAFGDLLGAERRLRSRDPQRPGGLSYAQVRALVTLADEDAVTAGQLARLAGLTPGSVTTMLDHLEEKQIVERRRSESDRRVVVVSLTPRGRELVAEKRARWHRRWNEACADLSDEQVRGAAEVMRRMTRMFDDL
jgi:DNA-binding MarR family transcriptional regulator